MNKNRVFIFEYVSGGGFNKFQIPASLFAEAFGMLKSIITDFKDLDFEIETLLDFRVHFLSRYLKADYVNIVQNKDDIFTIFNEYVKKSKYCFIIAPEFFDILYKLTAIAYNNECIILSVGLKGIILGTSKLKVFNFFQEKKINTPRTFLIPYRKQKCDTNFIIKKLKEFDAPIIIKPENGVGAESIYYFETEKQVIEFFNKPNENLDLSRNYILQEYVEGKDLSASLIGPRDKNIVFKRSPTLIGINVQSVMIKDSEHESKYLGGYTPYENWEETAISLKKIFTKLELSYFNGYFGIDFIQKQDRSLSLIEINPRLTTSYIGLRNIINQNIAHIILNYNENFSDLEEIQYNGFSKFGYLNLKYKGTASFEDLREKVIPILIKDISEIITPPIKFNNDIDAQNDYYSCFIATKTQDYLSSEIRIKKIIKIFEKKEFRIIK